MRCWRCTLLSNMAANVATDIPNNTQKKRKPAEKYCLASPYTSEWPALERGDNKNILDEIRRVFLSLSIEKGKEDLNNSKADDLLETRRNIRKSLVFGVNEVTKSLEKDNLKLVLVCKSTKPFILTNHLILLSATRSTPACGIFGLSDVLASLTGMKTVAACGFKEDLTVEILQDLVEYIVCKTPPLQSWLSIWNETTSTCLDKRTNETEKNNDQKMTGSFNDAVQCDSLLKRKKADDCSYVKAFVKTLQPSGKTKVKRTKMKKVQK